MELLASEIDDVVPKVLIHSLKTEDGAVGTASYALSRNGRTFGSAGADQFTPVGGNKIIKIIITGSEWVDPDSFKVQMDVVNNGTVDQILRPLSSPHAFFKRVRLNVGGALPENIENYNRVSEMFQNMKAVGTNVNSDAEGFGRRFDLMDFKNLEMTADHYTGIKAGQRMTVSFKPLLGLLHQKQMFNLKFCPMTLELELCSNYLDPIVTPLVAGAGHEFDTANTSALWTIENCKVKCDLCQFDSEMENSYSSALTKEAKKYAIHYQTFHALSQSIPPGSNDFTMNVNRTLTRLTDVFVSLQGTRGGAGTTDGSYCPHLKEFNDFWSPMCQYTKAKGQEYDEKGEIDLFSISLGSKKLIDYDIASHSEAMSQLRKTLGVQSNSLHNFDISRQEYMNNKLIMGVTCEVLAQNTFTGHSLKNGEAVTCRFRHNPIINNTPTVMHVLLVSDNVLEIRAGGCEALE
jgi:hypothetical protein